MTPQREATLAPGPRDVDDVDPHLPAAPGVVDFGALRVPVPERGTLTVDPSENGRMQAVHVSLPEGRLSVSALAAPKSARLWPELAKEIDESLRAGGARVRSFPGEWGRELHATSGAATSVFVGVDGARWMLYGVSTGPTRDAGPLLEELRRMVRGTVVVRGRSPYPVRTVLPLDTPADLAGDDAVPAAPTVVVRAVRPVHGGRPEPAGGLSRPAARPVGAGPDLDDMPTDEWPDGLLAGSDGGRPRPAGRPRVPPSPVPPSPVPRRSEPPRSVPPGPVPSGPGPTGPVPPGRMPQRSVAPSSVSPRTGVPGGRRWPGPPHAGDVPEVLRRGRHAAPETAASGPARHSGGQVTEPLAVIRPAAADRPGRHRRPD